MVSTVARQRRLKVRAGTLGWFLCWAVVFADIGTSIYYVPGILYGSYGTRSITNSAWNVGPASV